MKTILSCLALLCLSAFASAQCPPGGCPCPGGVCQPAGSPRPGVCVGPNCGGQPRPLAILQGLPRPR